ncbi:diguanylate cyclase (GGDEF)-like protein [Krasilnikovia cinnamomea]|uniref:Diguanylate cyclase (GGDEF)-like protein n=1 Tax=Krasilnikovia cinnamomea TaxID=349313 RepID=A0A4Q7ZIR4_9ACTN|nr:diguanylate cyclase [Krasilnikovia cinnamomea]RZU50351.1 diguanylate cyclase (GGDEF)-like protein [Krasilnikovia cinnamomea]
MTLRGRLTTAFLVVVLGPVLLGSVFVGMTVATVRRDRAVERLDHAATTVRTAIGAVCRQLQAVADAVAVLPTADRRLAADQLIARGLAAEITIGRTGSAPPAHWRDCADPADVGVAAIAARAQAPGVTVAAGQVLDAAFVDRLAASSGAEVTLLSGDGAGAAPTESTEPPYARSHVAALAAGLPSAGHGDGQVRRTTDGDRFVRRIALAPGQPLPLAVSVPGGGPTGLYALLIGADLAVAAVAVLVARWLARSTTRPLADLVWAAGRVADGELDTRVPVLRHDELGRLASTFNRMTRELRTYVQALTASRDQLRGHLAILGDTLSSTHDVHRILRVILQTALSATGARGGVVLLIDPADHVLVARCAEGLSGRWDVPETELPGLRVPLGEGVLGTVAATGVAQRGSHPGGEPPCRTYVAVPICAPPTVGDPLVPGEATGSAAPVVLGVLALYDRLGMDEFDDADLMTLRTFAGQAGVAVHNVRVHEEAQRLSLTDPLTGLWNYRYLRESLRREVERASRFGRMLAILVLDLDHFKNVNDTYGHAAGDTVLGEFARRIRLGLREVDVAFRQGGEEFVVLLPETDGFGAATVAERLGAAIRDIPVPIDRRRADAADEDPVDRIPVSVSIGIAVYPDHGGTAQEVLDAADDALYAAKNAGRDRYRMAAPGVSPGRPRCADDRATTRPGGPQTPRQNRGR